MRTRRRAVAVAVGLLLLLASSAAPGTPAAADHEAALPVVFVHGFSGSGAQYETQALRWASNDYPNVVTAIDRVSATPAVIYPILDAFFDDLLEQTGAPQLYVLGHSQGTAVMAGYLNSSAERAARVAKYIGIDGLSLASCPGAVPCRGIWARGSTARVLGSNNVYLSDHGHTESVGSAASFAAQYEFFLGHAPATTDILPVPPGQVDVAGRALNFPANTGLAGATLQLWEVENGTGVRKTASPLVEAVLDSSGDFGPWRVNGQQRYELTVIRDTPEGGTRTQHFYYEPWIRDNALLRLNLSPLDSDLAQNIDSSAESGGASIVRQKEWWGNNQLGPSDRLRIATTSASWGDQSPFDIVNGVTAPFTGSTIALITFDNDSDETSHTDAIVPLGPFLSGVDVWYPAADPPDGTISFIHDQRNFDTQQVINTPNWATTDHFMTVNFRDWVQAVDSWPECVRARPNPCG